MPSCGAAKKRGKSCRSGRSSAIFWQAVRVCRDLGETQRRSGACERETGEICCGGEIPPEGAGATLSSEEGAAGAGDTPGRIEDFFAGESRSARSSVNTASPAAHETFVVLLFMPLESLVEE